MNDGIGTVEGTLHIEGYVDGESIGSTEKDITLEFEEEIEVVIPWEVSPDYAGTQIHWMATIVSSDDTNSGNNTQQGTTIVN
ncbi:MAG: hypothetical protein GQ583_00370 [Methyloprofundus sp.]|nr:hypothetical protein [Methyloprofundus sp.]